MRTGSTAAAGLRRSGNLPSPCVIAPRPVEIHIGRGGLGNSRIPRSRERSGPPPPPPTTFLGLILSLRAVYYTFFELSSREPRLYRLSLIQAAEPPTGRKHLLFLRTCSELRLLRRNCYFDDVPSRLSSARLLSLPGMPVCDPSPTSVLIFVYFPLSRAVRRFRVSQILFRSSRTNETSLKGL